MSFKGKIIGNKYLGIEPRWFIVIKDNPKTIVVRRLKIKNGPKDKFGNGIQLPGTTPYGDTIRLKKSGSHFNSSIEGPVIIYNGNYEEWEKELDELRNKTNY